MMLMYCNSNEDLLKDIDLPENVKQTLIKEIKHRLAEKPVKVQSIIEVICDLIYFSI